MSATATPADTPYQPRIIDYYKDLNRTVNLSLEDPTEGHELLGTYPAVEMNSLAPGDEGYPAPGSHPTARVDAELSGMVAFVHENCGGVNKGDLLIHKVAPWSRTVAIVAPANFWSGKRRTVTLSKPFGYKIIILSEPKYTP